MLSYDYKLPFDRLIRANRFSQGWTLSGITRFASGFPVTMIDNGDNSLIGTNPNGVNNSSIDESDYNGRPLRLNQNPRTNGNNFFDASAFRRTRWALRALRNAGSLGPGADNYDMALGKSLPITGAEVAAVPR